MPATIAKPTADSKAMSPRNAASPVTAAQSVAGSPFFKLPPELRNRIYESALVTSVDAWGGVWPIPVTKEGGIPEPGLLATCKTIRKEAIGIYYEESFFELVLENCDSAPLVLWKQKQKSLLEQYNVMPYYPCELTHNGYHRSWKNFKIWLKRAHQGSVCSVTTEELDLESIRSCGDERAEWELILAMLEMAETMRDQPWAKVEKLVEIFHCPLQYSGDTMGWWMDYQ